MWEKEQGLPVFHTENAVDGAPPKSTMCELKCSQWGHLLIVYWPDSELSFHPRGFDKT